VFGAQMITPRGEIWGDIVLTKDYFSFISYGQKTPEDLTYANCKDDILEKRTVIYKWNEIEELFKKKFSNLYIAVDIFTIYKKNKTFNLTTLEKADRFFKLIDQIKQENSKMLNCDIIANPVDTFKARSYLLNWKENEMSNMEFLLLVNKFSGRSFNDMA